MGAIELEGFFCLRANLPSRASDNAPKTNNITANDKSISELKQSKKATNIAKINLLEVIIVGKFFIILNWLEGLLNDHAHTLISIHP